MASLMPRTEGERLGRRARVMSAAAAISALLAAPGVALAAPGVALATPTVAATTGCFVNTTKAAPVTVVGTGWTPGDEIELTSADHRLFADVTAAADGSIAASIPGASLHTSGPGVLNETLTGTDEGNDTTDAPANGDTATTSVQITNLAFSVSPQKARFTKPVTFSFSGFTEGKEIYAHYLHRGKVVASQKFGHATGACGLLKKKALQYPGGHPKFKSYTVQFDNLAHYNKSATPRFVSQLSILTF
jgi:hypothetical protein